MGKLLLISVDAVSDDDLSLLSNYPGFKKFLSQAALVRDVKSIFLSNTYPIHTSVVTGVHPRDHGIISNKAIQPSAIEPDWNVRSSLIKSKTLWQAAYEKGLSVACVMWPVTARAKEIRYNIPEVQAKKGKSQVFTSLSNGSKFTQIKAVMRHGKRLDGKSQPKLDDFSTHAMCDIIRESNPDLAMIHLTAYDSICHEHGKADEKSRHIAFSSLDRNLAMLTSCVSDDTSVIVFSDHGQFDVSDSINPNRILEQMGLLKIKPDGTLYDYKCFFECCGGSAFFYNKSCYGIKDCNGYIANHDNKACNGNIASDDDKACNGYIANHDNKACNDNNKESNDSIGCSDEQIENIKAKIASIPGFGRFLTRDEMEISGHQDLPFGICARLGTSFDPDGEAEKANHGYPLDYSGYNVFYAVKCCESNSLIGVKKGASFAGGSLLDVTALSAKILGVELPDCQGVLNPMLFG